jgi:hypothetical protein
MQELQENPEDENDDGTQPTLALKEVEKQSFQPEADQVSRGAMFSQVKSIRSIQDIGYVFASDDSRVLVGLPESFVGKINQPVEDLRAEKSSVAVVGVFSDDFIFENKN